MGNPLMLKKASVIIRERAKVILNNLQLKIDNGEINSELELKYESYYAIKEFISSLNKPYFKPIYAELLPIAKDYNQMLSSIKEDFNIVFKECGEIVSALEYAFHRVEVERKQLDIKINEINKKIKEIDLKINKKSNELVFEETFENQEKLDLSIIGDDNECSIQNNILTLKKAVAEEIEEDTLIKISGNGFLGNTHEIRLLNGAYQFYGEDNLHIDLNTIRDKNADTWIEYELFYLKEEVLKQVDYLGFDYKEKVSWMSKEKIPLNLTIEIEFSYSKNMNWISIYPFLGIDKTTQGFDLEALYIDDGKGYVNNIVKNPQKINTEKAILFEKQKVKKIIIKLKQNYSYETLVGHFFYQEVNKQKTLGNQEEGKRIEGEKQSIEILGYRYNPLLKALIPPTSEVQKSLYNIEQQKQELFRTKTMVGDIQSGLEALQAKRYMIGIRDINTAAYEFYSSSVYISKPFESQKPIKEISFDSMEYIPSYFIKSEWVKYYISIDDGKSWIQINRKSDLSVSTKKKIIINQNIPIEGRFNDTIYIDYSENVNKFRVKIELSRPTSTIDNIYYTPIIYQYSVSCLTD